MRSAAAVSPQRAVGRAAGGSGSTNTGTTNRRGEPGFEDLEEQDPDSYGGVASATSAPGRARFRAPQRPRRPGGEDAAHLLTNPLASIASERICGPGAPLVSSLTSLGRPGSSSLQIVQTATSSSRGSDEHDFVARGRYECAGPPHWRLL